jgi:hypothetical protein
MSFVDPNGRISRLKHSWTSDSVTRRFMIRLPWPIGTHLRPSRRTRSSFAFWCKLDRSLHPYWTAFPRSTSDVSGSVTPRGRGTSRNCAPRARRTAALSIRGNRRKSSFGLIDAVASRLCSPGAPEDFDKVDRSQDFEADEYAVLRSGPAGRNARASPLCPSWRSNQVGAPDVTEPLSFYSKFRLLNTVTINSIRRSCREKPVRMSELRLPDLSVQADRRLGCR